MDAFTVDRLSVFDAQFGEMFVQRSEGATASRAVGEAARTAGSGLWPSRVLIAQRGLVNLFDAVDLNGDPIPRFFDSERSHVDLPTVSGFAFSITERQARTRRHSATSRRPNLTLPELITDASRSTCLHVQPDLIDAVVALWSVWILEGSLDARDEWAAACAVIFYDRPQF